MKKILLILTALTVSAAAFAEKITTVAGITSGYKYYIGATTGGDDFYFSDDTDPLPVDSLVIKGKATKMEYEVGEAFDPAGLEVWGIYTKIKKHDSTSQITEGFTWSIDPETFEWAGDNESVTIVANYEGLTTADTTITGIKVNAVVPGRLAPCCINGKKLTINDLKASEKVNMQYFKYKNDERINGIAGDNPNSTINLFDTEGYCEINYTNKDDVKRNFIVNPKIENAVDSIYQGETYLFADTLLTTAGTYQRTIESNSMTLTLKVKQKPVEIKDAEFTYGDAGNNLINFTLGNSDYSFDLYVKADNVVGDFKEVVDLTESSIETSNGTISLLEVYSFSVTGIGKVLTLTVSVLGSDNKQYNISATGYYGYIQGDAKDGCNKEFAAKGIALDQIKINEVNYISIQGESASGDVMEIAVKGELNDGKIATGTYTDIAASTGFTPEYQVFPSYIGNDDAVWFIQSGTLTVAADGSMKFVGVNSYDASIEITISASGPTVDKTGITINGRKYGFPVRMVTDVK